MRVLDRKLARLLKEAGVEGPAGFEGARLQQWEQFTRSRKRAVSLEQALTKRITHSFPGSLLALQARASALLDQGHAEALVEARGLSEQLCQGWRDNPSVHYQAYLIMKALGEEMAAQQALERFEALQR